MDLFHDILATFSEDNFSPVGLTTGDRSLIGFMGDSECGRATLLSSLLGGAGDATPQCTFPRDYQLNSTAFADTYNYPFETVHEALDFIQESYSRR